MEKPASAATVGVEGLELKLQAQILNPLPTLFFLCEAVCILLRKSVSTIIQTKKER